MATVKVDYARRQNIAPNHTCTHVLNHALLATLGGDISQKGSLVRP
jgi:alanyl-tRNA synthetase